MELSPQAEARIKAAEAALKMSPLLAFPGGALRLSLVNELAQTAIRIEFFEPGSREAEVQTATVASNIELVKVALEAGLMVISRRDAEAKWIRVWERPIKAAGNVVLPSVVLDFGIKR